MIWYAGGPQGYLWVFLIGTGVALLNWIVVRGIKEIVPPGPLSP